VGKKVLVALDTGLWSHLALSVPDGFPVGDRRVRRKSLFLDVARRLSPPHGKGMEMPEKR